MDPILLTVAFKGVGMLAAILGGIWVARYGFHLYKDGVGSSRDRAAFEVGPLKMKAHSVGSVVMATAFLWVWAGVYISPSLEKKGEDWKISLTTPEMNLQNLAVTVSLPKSDDSIKTKPEELKKLFEAALAVSNTLNQKKVIQLNGKPAEYDLQSIRALKSEMGQYLVTTELKSEDKTATVSFEPMIQTGRVIFVPTGIGVPLVKENK